MREIDVVSSRHQRVKIIAADAALHFRKAPLDLAGLARGDGKEIADQRLRHIHAGIAEPAEMRVRAVGQHSIDRQHVLARIAVAQRARAAGIVADHAADGGARRRRDIHREPQTGRFQLAVKLVEHDARLDRAAPAGGIDVDDAVEMRRAVDDERLVDGLAGLRRAATARRHRHTFRAADRNRPIGFFDRARRRHAKRHDLIMRCVGGIAPTRKCVEADAADAAHLFRLQPAFESRHEPCWHVVLHAQK